MAELSIRDAFKSLEDIEDMIEVKVQSKVTHTVNESCEAQKDEAMLEPEYDSRKSFYGKADIRDEDGDKVLYSYGTPVAKITKDNEVELLKGTLPQTKGYSVELWRYSPTTLRHVKEFLKQNGFKAESSAQMQKDYVHESLDVSEDKTLTESETVNLNDKEDIEKGKEFLDKSETHDDNIEQIVDVDAETVDELKDSYVGNVILQCPVCKTLVYKKPELLKKDEEDENLYNKEDECTHCGSKGGYELVGQVATLDVKAEEPEATTGVDSVDNEIEADDKPEKEEAETDKTSEEKKDDIAFESLDEEKFDKLIKKYVNNIYENVDSYTSVKGSINDDNNTLVVEGIIKFKNSKELNTKFVFEAIERTSDNKIMFKGLNETFTRAKKPFTLIASVVDNNLICESLNYNYNVRVINEIKKVKGKVYLK